MSGRFSRLGCNRGATQMFKSNSRLLSFVACEKRFPTSLSLHYTPKSYQLIPEKCWETIFLLGRHIGFKCYVSFRRVNENSRVFVPTNRPLVCCLWIWRVLAPAVDDGNIPIA